MKYVLPLLFLLTLLSCDKTINQREKEVDAISVDVELRRFDKDFAMATVSELENIKRKYPAFFPEQFADTVWISKMQDTLQIELEEEVLKAFPDNEPLEKMLESLYKHVKYDFKKFNPPVAITTTSDVDYRNKIIWADSILVIALDNYLGEDHHFYQGLERYFAKEMKPSQLAPDVAHELARKFVMPPRKNTFLNQIVYYGKMLYLQERWLPKVPAHEIIGYEKDEYQWAEENEVYMWQYFIENELLYSSDPKLPARFINPAPFSKFYLEIDNESPGMLGRYLGWKIVKAYMKNNTESVEALMITDAEEIFKKSKYKPKK